MSGTGISEDLDDRIARLERALAETIDQVDGRSADVEFRVRRLERRILRADPTTPDATAGPAARVAPAVDESTPDRSATSRTEWDAAALSDLVGGRLLAWVGGVSVVLAILLFLALAISHGWIGEQARVLLAGAASVGLLAAGAWLRRHRGRTDAATAIVGAGTAGMFATLIVASDVYRLVPPLAALAGALAVGAVATTLAIRWAGRPIAVLGLGGALLAPVLVGAPSGIATLAMLGVATACAMRVASRQRWDWLGLGAVLAAAPQWAFWSLGDRSAVGEVVVVGGFALLGLAGGAARGREATGARSPESTRTTRPSTSRTAALCLNACLAALVGYVVLQSSAGHTAAVLWLVGLAAVHAGVALAPRYGGLATPTGQLVVGLAAVLADVAFGLATHGIALTAGWGALSVGLAWALGGRSVDSRALEVGLAAHIALVLIRVVLVAPPGAASGSLAGLLSIATLAAAALACGHLSQQVRPARAAGLNVLGLAAIAYLTAGGLDGPALAGAWAVDGLALIRLAGAGRDAIPWHGGLAFLGLAAGHAVVFDAPPTGLVSGLGELTSAAVALGAVACAAIAAGRLHPPATTPRRGLLGVGAVAVLYLASVALVTAFERHAAGAGVLDLSVGQQAQVALSGLWSLAGLAAVVLGLRRRLAALRVGGLALLLVSVGKVFTYDLSTLGSIYRVASVLTLGLLLLIAALTYQRLRPPPAPDLRTLHPSQR